LPTPSPTPEPATVDWLSVEGKTADGRIFLGNPDAPVTIIDYSDFM
ncbi:MAG: disulfide bond formation protein DsbA, partial [Caldilineae bacterium]